jgi:DNA polymerase I
MIITRNPFQTWKRKHINDKKKEGQLYSEDLQFMITEFMKDRPYVLGFDTETTGLHIKKDKPFLIQFGWLVHGEEDGKVFTFYPTQENMKVFLQLCERGKFVVANNIKYDLHMLTNIGYGDWVENKGIQWVDLMAVSRLSLESIPQREGGDSLALKDLAVKYVHQTAADGEQKIKQDLRRLKDEQITFLTAALKQFDHPTAKDYKPIRKDTGKATTGPYAQNNPDNVEWKWIKKKWNKGLVENFLKDITNEPSDLPEDVREVYEMWKEEYPEPTYEDIDRELMIRYGADDIISLLELFRMFSKVIRTREQGKVLKLEMDCILPAYRMERTGLKADLVYLEESRKKVKATIIENRKRLYEIAGKVVNISGNSQDLPKLFKEKWNITLEKTNKPVLKKLMKEYEGDPSEVASLVSKLRRLEKWYSTYITRIIDNASYDGYVYTQLNMSGAVSGRMASDFQQFPKDPLEHNGVEIYHPRKAFTVRGGEYDSIVYIDYDQIELVTQSHFTLLVSGGDPNLCRAYMPFNCIHYRTQEKYDYRTKEQRDRWDERQPNGDSAWIVPETNKPWVKTDVHAETTHKAFPHIPLGTDEFKKWRSKGKIFNFMANYGGGKWAAVESLDLKEDEADALVRGYNEAFPHVKIYQQKITVAHGRKGYVQNLYGRRYYLQDPNRAYKLANYNVQGTCADALKEAVIMLDRYLQDKKTKMIVPIHDEIQFAVHSSEKGIEQKLMEIMQEAFHWSLVPVTAGVEVTYTDWSSKKEVA